MPAVYNSLRAQRRGISLQNSGYFDENGNWVAGGGGDVNITGQYTGGDWMACVKDTYDWVQKENNRLGSTTGKSATPPSTLIDDCNHSIRIDCSGAVCACIMTYWNRLKRTNGVGYNANTYQTYIAGGRFHYNSQYFGKPVDPNNKSSFCIMMEKLGFSYQSYSVSGIRAGDIRATNETGSAGAGHVEIIASLKNKGVMKFSSGSSKSITMYREGTLDNSAGSNRAWKTIWHKTGM
ncbi:MAG: hypothetical protein J1F35_06160 [Erysipelotrichales bacterium]|nr:hypothetical protein [Erysipelotrichales bacterium]